MKSQFFTSLTNVMLLSISLCITELMNQSYGVNEMEKCESKVISIDTEADILNPIYIFK
ncbi:MAG TPA: hypothetical protein VD794_09900 [Flavisolibacter sp.]|nr:hypothetical protein [Flavisolibacter sp.]